MLLTSFPGCATGGSRRRHAAPGGAGCPSCRSVRAASAGTRRRAWCARGWRPSLCCSITRRTARLRSSLGNRFGMKIILQERKPLPNPERFTTQCGICMFVESAFALPSNQNVPEWFLSDSDSFPQSPRGSPPHHAGVLLSTVHMRCWKRRSSSTTPFWSSLSGARCFEEAMPASLCSPGHRARTQPAPTAHSGQVTA